MLRHARVSLWCLPLLVVSHAAAQATVGVFHLADAGPNSGHRQAGTSTPLGTIQVLGNANSIDAGAISTTSGLTAYNHGAGLLYMIGGSKVYSISTTTGVATSQTLGEGSSASIAGLYYDEPDDRLLGLFSASSSDRAVKTIDPTNGAVASLANPTAISDQLHSGADFSANVGPAAGDNAGNKFYFTAMPARGGSGIYSVDTVTGNATVAPLVGVAYNHVAALEYDEAEGVLYAFIFAVGGRQLATINVGTGVVTTLGSVFAINSTTHGVSALNALGNLFIVPAEKTAGSVESLYVINTATGGELASHAVNDLSTTLQSGQYVGLAFQAAPVPVELLSFRIE